MPVLQSIARLLVFPKKGLRLIASLGSAESDGGRERGRQPGGGVWNAGESKKNMGWHIGDYGEAY